MKKTFTIIKIGYTVGVYGCSGEYFQCIYTDKRGGNNFIFQGLYGVEDRIKQAMADKGYHFFHTASIYGKLTRNDGTSLKWIKSEYEALDFIKKEKLDWNYHEKLEEKRAARKVKQSK